MSENRYWLLSWMMAGIVLVAIGGLIIFSGYLDDKRDLEMASKGLHKYKVERCSGILIKNEWHEAGWNNATNQNQ
jgi:hypothetical protein